MAKISSKKKKSDSKKKKKEHIWLSVIPKHRLQEKPNPCSDRGCTITSSSQAGIRGP